MSKKFMYGIGAVTFAGFTLGYIEKNSWNNNPSKPEVAEVNAEQVPGVPVLLIPQSNGKLAPTFNLIQLDYVNMKAAMGGELVYASGDTKKENPIGWIAPKSIVQLAGGWQIDLVSGQSIMIANGTLLAALGGQLTLTETAKIECELRIAEPEDAGEPYAIFETDQIPEAWKKRCNPTATVATNSDGDEGGASGS